jgi:hypothetical protein
MRKDYEVRKEILLFFSEIQGACSCFSIEKSQKEHAPISDLKVGVGSKNRSNCRNIHVHLYVINFIYVDTTLSKAF